MNITDYNKGVAKREELDVVRTLDVLELNQGEFKYITDARNGILTYPGLGYLKAAAQRQSEVKARAAAADSAELPE